MKPIGKTKIIFHKDSVLPLQIYITMFLVTFLYNYDFHFCNTRYIFF